MTDDASGFRSLIDVGTNRSVADVVAQINAEAPDYVVSFDVAAGICWALRRATASEALESGTAEDLAAELIRVDSALAVWTDRRVDSEYRANKILADHSPARLLIIIEDGAPTRAFGLDTASAAVRERDERQWITDMPNDESLMASRMLLLGATPTLRTRITDEMVTGGYASSIDAALLQDRKISFGLIGENVAFRRAGEPGDLTRVHSDYLDPLGADAAYEVLLVPKQAGPAAIEVDIMFDDDEQLPDTQRIEFTVIDPGALGKPESTQEPEVRTPFAVPPEASVWIRWDGDDLAYDMDGRTDTHALATSVGAFEGAELRDLIAELETAARSYVAADPDTLTLADSEAAMRSFAWLGARLHGMVYGESVHDADSEIADRAVFIASLGRESDASNPPRMRIEDDRLGIPWELMYDGHYDGKAGNLDDDPIDPVGFWGHRFRIDHPVPRGKRGARAAGDHILTSLPPQLASFVSSAITNDAEANALLVEMNNALATAVSSAGATIASDTDDFRKWVASGGSADVLYLFGHGTGATSVDGLLRPEQQGADEQASIQIDEATLSVDDLKELVPPSWELNGSPLVFLNACRTMQGDDAYSRPFVDLFYKRWLARAVVGAVASVPASFAVGFAERTLTSFVAGNEQIGQSLYATTRELLDQGNPYGLLYALFGRSELQIRRIDA